MYPLSGRVVAYLLIDLALLACCILRVPDLQSRARDPFDVLRVDGRVVVSRILSPDDCTDVARGDELVSFSGLAPLSDRSVEFLTDFRSIGERVPVTYRRGSEIRSTAITMIPYFTGIYVVMVMAAGLISLVLAVYVFLRRPRDSTAASLHWALVGLGVSMIMAWEGRSPASLLGYIGSLAFFFPYATIAAAFLLFTTLFPRPKFGRFGPKAVAIIVPAAAITIPMVVQHYDAVTSRSLGSFERYLGWFDAFHAGLIVFACGGILNFVHSYITAATLEERKKLKWVLFGLSLGPLPFLLFTVLPLTVAPQFAVPEPYTLGFLVAIPLSFTISFMRYHILDIDLVLNRATVYGLVIGFLLLLYTLVVGTIAQLVGQSTQQAAVIAAVIVAVMFQPVRDRTQRFVDRRFFRVRYNFREAERRVIADIKRAMNVQHLAELVVRQIEDLLAVEQVGFLVRRNPGTRLEVLAQRNIHAPERFVLPVPVSIPPSRLSLPIALPERLESGIEHEPATGEWFRRSGVVLAFPMLSEHLQLLGYLALGEKKSGSRYTIEDADLLHAVTAQAGLAIEHLELHERFILEHAEMERLEDLNRMKSDFVSYVSHELRTPLTSIKLFAELLGVRVRPNDRKAKECLTVIEGECERLNRMVTTILDSAKMEQGIMQYSFRPVDLRQIAAGVLEIMRYQLTRQGFRVICRLGKRPLPLAGDPDAITDAIINLIGNSIKYSAERKRLTVIAGADDTGVFCSVSDEGVGISPAAIPHLFERFYRDPTTSHPAASVGLGLSFVKHVMDAHHGTIGVESTLGKGSTFVLRFPRNARSKRGADGGPSRRTERRERGDA